LNLKTEPTAAGPLVALADRIERWPIDRLRPYERNPRTHSEAQVDQIAASMAAVLFPRYAKGMPAMLSRLDTVRSPTLLGEGGSVLPFTNRGFAEFLAWWSVLPVYQLSYCRLDQAIERVSTLTNTLCQGSDSTANAALAPSAFGAKI
jgi:hypothetical protein